ncbi:MAG TPA: hypothetical protein VG406_18635 [Isosphaeraceae bacterium]|jgi:hypothetical protein|nr:hypothetical protein [Isosphaeraceae bacterium]
MLRPRTPLILLVTCLAPTLATAAAQAAGDRPFAIVVVDEATGRGVPLVELRTVNDIRLVTDSAGVAEVVEPGLAGKEVFFHVKSHGYEYPKDGFGYRGKALRVVPGGEAKLTIQRIHVAERLYRVTGAGIYRDSVLLGRPVPLRKPVLNGDVLGSDSVQSAIYKGKIRWFWGDTNRPGYPLGNFHTPGASSLLPGDGGLDPAVGVDLDYLVDDRGFAKETAHMPGDGPTWIDGLVALRDADGRERLFAKYVKIRPPMDTYARGLVEWDDAADRFRRVATFPLDAPLVPAGHTFLHRVDGLEYVYFATPYPLVRVRADSKALADLSRYEAFTCLKAGSRLDHPFIDRDAEGRILYAWKRDTPAVGPAEQAKLVEEGPLKPEEVLLSLRDAETGQGVFAHAGSVNWNAYRKRWVMITAQAFGASMLGETWYAEADTPLGPWTYARKVVSHDRYSFYNPEHHPFFDQAGGRLIYFEGTYTHTFSGNDDATSRYDYNQIMYRLDLDDPRLNLPVPFSGDRPAPRSPGLPVAFYALERPGPATVAVFRADDGRLVVGKVPNGRAPLFHALPADVAKPPETTTLLYEFIRGDEHVYSTAESLAGHRRADRPFCRVWRSPTAVVIPKD